MNQEGYIILGEGGDNSDEENVVFQNDPPPPSEEESNHDKESIDKDAATQQSQLMPYNSIMSFGRQVICTGTSTNSALSMRMPLQVGHCASWKMSKRMSKSN